MSAPRTRDMAAMLDALEVGRNALLLLSESDANVELSARNLPNVRILRVNYLNVRDLLGYSTIVIHQDALSVIESFLGDDQEIAVEE